MVRTESCCARGKPTVHVNADLFTRLPQQSALIICIVALVFVPSYAIGRSSLAMESADSVASALLAEAQPSKLLAVLAIGAPAPQPQLQPTDVATGDSAADDSEEASSTTAAIEESGSASGPRRQRRQSSADYYSNYYNDYYNNYYNNLNSRPVAPAPAPAANNYYRPASADRFDGNANSIDGNGGGGFASDGRPQQQVINGQKYVYTPLFQYKATQGHHQKLFVPNLFG